MATKNNSTKPSNNTNKPNNDATPIKKGCVNCGKTACADTKIKQGIVITNVSGCWIPKGK